MTEGGERPETITEQIFVPMANNDLFVTAYLKYKNPPLVKRCVSRATIYMGLNVLE
jgi:hypothetical protein